MPNVENDKLIDEHIVAYKTLLREYLNRRPSGIRKKISSAINTHRSFISQVANPNYRVPLPAQYVPTLMAVCQFTADEQETFLAAYSAAHPGQARIAHGASVGDNSSVTVDLSAIPNEADRIAVSAAIHEMADSMVRLVQAVGVGANMGDGPLENAE